MMFVPISLSFTRPQTPPIMRFTSKPAVIFWQLLLSYQQVYPCLDVAIHCCACSHRLRGLISVGAQGALYSLLWGVNVIVQTHLMRFITNKTCVKACDSN